MLLTLSGSLCVAGLLAGGVSPVFIRSAFAHSVSRPGLEPATVKIASGLQAEMPLRCSPAAAVAQVQATLEH